MSYEALIIEYMFDVMACDLRLLLIRHIEQQIFAPIRLNFLLKFYFKILLWRISELGLFIIMQSEIFKALQKTRLISGDKKELQYSRCGRTDKGVSSVGQVSIYL